MLDSFRQWIKKWRLKRHLDQELRTIVGHMTTEEFDPEEDYEFAIEMTKKCYIRLGLTREEVELVWENIGPIKVV